MTLRYVAFLRGVSPMNCKMPALKRCVQAAGFSGINTLLSSGQRRLQRQFGTQVTTRTLDTVRKCAAA